LDPEVKKNFSSKKCIIDYISDYTALGQEDRRLVCMDFDVMGERDYLARSCVICGKLGCFSYSKYVHTIDLGTTP
jgi:hypothetical protein